MLSPCCNCDSQRASSSNVLPAKVSLAMLQRGRSSSRAGDVTTP
jgi:hypothetical protein